MIAAGAALVAAAVAISGATLISSSPLDRPRKLLIVSMPAVTWEDVDRGSAPNLEMLGRRWSMGAMSIRSVGSRTDPASAYASIGAGNRARGLGRDNIEFVPRTVASRQGGLFVERIRDVRADNAVHLHHGARPGLLGDLLHREGLRTAVVGNLDGDALREKYEGSGPSRFHEVRRFGGLALADQRGRLDAGETGESLVIKDPSTKNGFRTDPDALVSAMSRAIADADVVLVELGDSYREGQVLFSEFGEAGVREVRDPFQEHVPERQFAIARDDALLGRIVEEIDLSQDAVMVLGTAGVGPSIRERLMVAVLAGKGAVAGGWLTSSTTKRDGLVTIADVGPGILRLYGIDAPSAMTGRPIRSVPGSRVDRLDHVVDLQTAALFHLRWLTPFFAALVLTQLVLYLSAWRPATRAGEGTNRAMRAATLVFLAVPGSTFVWHAFHPERLGFWAVPLLVGISGGLAALALAGRWRKRPSGPPAFLCAVTFAVIAVDLLTGANLQMSTLIGYSPIVAGRFFGIGNLDFAVFGTAAVLAASAAERFLSRGTVGVIAAAGLAAAVLNGAPTLGADFGGLVSLVIGFGVLLLGASGRRVSWTRVVLLTVAALFVGLLAGWLDSLRAPEAQTHMGRFVSRLIEGGPAAVGDVLARKASANWSVFTKSILSLSVPVAGIFLYLLLRRPRGRLRTGFEMEPGLRAGLVAAAALNLAGFAVNDSGIAVPAMGLAVAVPYCLAVILAIDPKPGPTET